LTLLQYNCIVYMMQNNERKMQINLLQKSEAIKVPDVIVDKTIVKEKYRLIKQIKNKFTGQTAVFVNNALNKILGHKGFEKRIILILAEAYENAIYMYDEPVNTAHKIHTNFKGYSNYIVKVLLDGQTIFARFTLANLKTKPNKEPISQFHSIHLSYENIEQI